MKLRKVLAMLLICAMLVGMSPAVFADEEIDIIYADDTALDMTGESRNDDEAFDTGDDEELDIMASEEEDESPEEVDQILSSEDDLDVLEADQALSTQAEATMDDARTNGADIPVDESHFKDAKFRAWVSDNCDTDHSGSLSDSEIAAVTAITPGESVTGITTLKGIEYFTNLTDLDIDGYSLTSLDLSGNTKLTVLYCSNLAAGSLDLTKNTALKTVSLYECQIKTLNMKGLTQLTQLNVEESKKLTALDLTNCVKLEVLSVRFCDSLKDLILTGCTGLDTLDCGFAALDFLDVKECTKLTWLNCQGNNLSGINLSKCTKLQSLYCDGNKLNMLDIAENKALINLYCDNNQLESLDLSWNESLEEVGCSCNNLKKLKLPDSTSLHWLRCEFNALEELDLSACTGLISVICSYNKLEKLDVNNCKKLEGLHCQGNSLSWLGVWNCQKLAALVRDGSMKVVTDFDYDDKYMGVVDWYSDSFSEDTGDGLKVDHDLQVLASAPTVDDIWLDHTALILYVGETCKLRVTVLPDDETSNSVTWKTSNSDIATIENGQVEAIEAGTATITVTSVADPSKKATCKVTVKQETMEKEITKTGSAGTVKLIKGQKLQLDPSFATDKGWEIKSYSSSKDRIASVSKDGLVKARRVGKTTITIRTKNNKKATVVIKVTDPTVPTKVKLNKKDGVKLNVGEKMYLKATIAPATAKTELKWKTSNRRFATVSKYGVVKGVKNGTVYITVKTDNGKSARVKIVVVDPTIPTKVKLNKKDTVKLETGDQLQLVATLSPSSAKSTLKWSTSNKRIAKVDGNGLVTAVKKGTATITVKTKKGGKTAQVKIIVVR